MIFPRFTKKLKEKAGGLLGGPKGMLAPPPKLLGGPGPPWPPLFLRLCALHIEEKKTGGCLETMTRMTEILFTITLNHNSISLTITTKSSHRIIYGIVFATQYRIHTYPVPESRNCSFEEYFRALGYEQTY